MSKNPVVLCIFFCLALPLLAKEGDPWNDNSPDSKPFFSSEEKPIVTVPLHGNNSFGSYFVIPLRTENREILISRKFQFFNNFFPIVQQFSAKEKNFLQEFLEFFFLYFSSWSMKKIYINVRLVLEKASV